MAQSPLNYTAKNPSNALVPLQTGVQGDLQQSAYHGNKYLLSYAGNLFVGANPSGVTTSVGLATTYVGLCLSNPAGNTKNLVVRRIGASVVVAPTAITGFGLITGFAAGGVTVHTTALAPFSAKIGSGTASTAKLDSAATLVGTPVWTEFFTTGLTTTAPTFSMDLEGSVILIPGAYAAIGTTVAGGASGFFGSFEWEEIAV